MNKIFFALVLIGLCGCQTQKCNCGNANCGEKCRNHCEGDSCFLGEPCCEKCECFKLPPLKK